MSKNVVLKCKNWAKISNFYSPNLYYEQVRQKVRKFYDF